MTLRFQIVFLLFSPALLIAQTGESNLDSVNVYGYRIVQPGVATLSKKRIESRLATDVGQLMTLFPGMQVRSYGGLGGLKTVSFRSLGAAHTSVVTDRFGLSQTQSGQTDLGQIPVDFIQRLSVVNQAGTSVQYPVHAKLAGQIIALETKHLPKYNRSLQLNAGTQVGSFGQADLHAFAGKEWQHFKIAASGKYRRFDGDYPFSYMNGQQRVETIRNNGDLEDAFGNASFTWMPDSLNEIHASYGYAKFNKGLPGAVVFYNSTAGQRLFGENHIATLRHQFTGKAAEVATGLSIQQAALDYVDSNYLNLQGFLHSHYLAQQADAQSQVKFRIGKYHEVLAGAEVRHEALSSAYLSIQPKRLSTFGLLAYKLGIKKTTLNAQAGLSGIDDQRTGTYSFRKLYFQPMIDLSRQLGKTGIVSGGYKYTVRQPSFTELYYNQVGNDDLRPERAHLAWLRFDYLEPLKQFVIRAGIQPFYVYATDKILAIPTKNLFAWSIQNIGISDAMGTEATTSLTWNFSRSALALNLNYTYQYTRDLSDPQSATYGHHLSYSPLHAGTAELSYERQRTGASLLFSYQGQRYALNQNIPANLVEDFVLLDLSAYYRFTFGKHGSSLTLRGALNNITNNYYSYIRYFVMPGINYTLRLTYEF